ncbi:MAG: hypothetical protein NTV51_03015 [Verrucomicrobia bacterium]|nr:hypothetical protein [Verrucomicrobiota bacterium]
MKLLPLALLGLLAAGSTLSAAPFTITYGGDLTPSEGAYAGPFTGFGPGIPGGGYFTGTDWWSDGDVLTMQTQHPNDYAGATSQGIWFGRTDGYGDPSNFSLASTTLGNRVDVRMALGANSSEWSLYWYDASGYGAALYLLDNGFQYYADGNAYFQAVSDMTAFHTYSTQVYNGQVSYYFDGSLLTSGTAGTGLANFLLLGDGSASSLSGYGTLRVDSMAITVEAGAPAPAGVPDTASSAFCLLGALTAGWGLRRRLLALA